MNIQQFGATIKQKYPQYNDLSDQEVGTKVLTKYPQYKDMIDAPKPMYEPAPKPKETFLDVLGRITGVKNYAQDVGAGITARKTAAGRAKINAQQETQAKALEDEAYSTSDMARKSYLLKQANVIREGQSAAARDVAATFSPDIEKNYWKRGFGTASQIAGTAALVGGITGSPAIGAFKGQQSLFKTIGQAAKTIVQPAKATGKALEAARSKVPVDVNEFRTDIVNRAKNSTEYLTDEGVTKAGKVAKGAFQADVDEVLRKMTSTMKNRAVTSLQEFTTNLEKMKGVNPEAVQVVKTALRESEKVWGNQPIERLAKLYHLEKMLEPTAKTVKRGVAYTVAGSAVAIPLLKKLGIVK